MKDMTKIRQINFSSIVDEYKNQEAVAEILGVSKGYISQLVIGYRAIGEKVARKIELKLKKPVYSLDIDTEGQVLRPELPAPEPTGNNEQPINPESHYLPVRMGSFQLQAGVTGYTVDYLDDDKAPIFFRADWFQENGYKPDRLIACQIRGDSMEPRLYAGDIVVINLDDTAPSDSSVFAINYEGELIIKRLVRDGGLWHLQSDNSDKTRHPNKICTGDICLLLGRIVYRQSCEI